MKKFDWDPKKNKQLIEERDFSFEGVIFHLQSDGLLDDIVVHSNQKKHSRQRIFIVAIEDYAYIVPYVESDNEILLQTIAPSRKQLSSFWERTMGNVKLNEEEKQLLEIYDSNAFKSVVTPARSKQIREAAANTFKKDKRINIRISSRDLDAIQKRALIEGIPYQTLVSSIIHKYVSGSLHDVSNNK